jgi:DSF synthase
MDTGTSSVILLTDEEEFLAESVRNAKVPDEILSLQELDVLYDDNAKALWTFMSPVGRPSFTHTMLRDFEAWQSLIGHGFGPGKIPLKYLVLGSRAPDVFCFGGDLELFQRLIRERDRDGLVNYGHRCCAILDRNIRSLDIPMLTVGLVQGAALGGGFEALLSFDFIIAERQATFGLPEIMFGLYPGMGAHALLSRMVGTAMAERIILSNETYTAEHLYELGIVHELAEPGDGMNAVREFMRRSDRRHAGMVGARRATKRVWQLELAELNRITEIWAESALQLREQDLKVMNRLVAAQARLAERAAVA